MNIIIINYVITITVISAKVMFSSVFNCLFVCLLVSRIT